MPNFDNIEDKPKHPRSTGSVGVDLERSIQQEERLEVQHRLAKSAPDIIRVPQCLVCTSPYRQFIEALLIRGHSYSSIAKRVPGPNDDEGNPRKIDRRTVSHHAKEHMSFEDDALREIIENEADLEGENYEDGKKRVLTHRAALQVAVTKAYEDILEGVTTVEPRDLIQIVKLMSEMDANQHQVLTDQYKSQVALFIQAIRDVLDPEQQTLIAARVKELRQRDGIDVELEGAMRPQLPVYVDAEVEE